MMHDFKESLRRSHAASDLLMWEQIYRRAFLNFAGRVMADYRLELKRIGGAP